MSIRVSFIANMPDHYTITRLDESDKIASFMNSHSTSYTVRESDRNQFKHIHDGGHKVSTNESILGTRMLLGKSFAEFDQLGQINEI